MFRAKFAPGLMKSLSEVGASVDNPAPGVYDVSGLSPIPLRIVTTSQLEGDEYAPLRALSEEASPEDAKAVSEAFEASTGEVHELWKKYLDHVVEKNLSVFESLVRKDGEGDGKGDSVVSDAILELVEDKVRERERAAATAAVKAATEAATAATKTEDIRSLMETMGWGADLAMSALKVSEQERARYITRITG